ncbi:MAG: hypothetical protein HY781_13390 [Chloroflexi bacterium]|nr:hypothetical protein [Chloroflexota bacterium]
MNRIIRNTLIVIAVLVLAGGVFFSGNMYARTTAFGSTGMMGGYGWNSGGNTGYGPGMMSGQGGYGMGPGRMGGYGYSNASVTALTLADAKAAAEIYLTALDNPDFKISEIMIFDNNAYVVVTEESTGLGAFELLVDPLSQVAYPEHGPNIMWNLKYGGLNHEYMMGGQGGMMNVMMGGNGLSSAIPADISSDMTVSPEKAIEYAQAYLDANLAGATAAADPVKFYGYYTLDFERDGVVVGMLSVNGFSGQVFLHTWHGTFIEELEY